MRSQASRGGRAFRAQGPSRGSGGRYEGRLCAAVFYETTDLRVYDICRVCDPPLGTLRLQCTDAPFSYYFPPSQPLLFTKAVLPPETALLAPFSSVSSEVVSAGNTDEPTCLAMGRKKLRVRTMRNPNPCLHCVFLSFHTVNLSGPPGVPSPCFHTPRAPGTRCCRIGRCPTDARVDSDLSPARANARPLLHGSPRWQTPGA